MNPCGGCGARYNPHFSMAVRSSRRDEDAVRVRYLGEERVTVRGPSGTAYAFGFGEPAKYVYVSDYEAVIKGQAGFEVAT